MSGTIFPDGSEGILFGLSPQSLDRLRKAVGDIQSVIQDSIPEHIAPPKQPLPKDVDVIGMALRIGGVPNALFAKEGDLTKPDALALRVIETDKSLARDALDRNLPSDTVLACEQMYRRSQQQRLGKQLERYSLNQIIVEALNTMHSVFTGQYFEQVARYLAQEAAASRQAVVQEIPKTPLPVVDPTVIH